MTTIAPSRRQSRPQRAGLRTSLGAAGAVVVLLAGCAEVAPAPTAAVSPGALQASDGRDLRFELTANDTVDAPSWGIGQFFGHHVFFGPDDQQGRHYNTIVVDQDATSWYLAADEQTAAKEEALWDIPILGHVNKSNLSSTGLGMLWDLFEWPLADAKSWVVETTWPSDAIGTQVTNAVRFTATYEAEISTPQGPLPGYAIVGKFDNGTLVWEVDYVPAIGWYAHLWLYDFTTADPTDFWFHSMTMGHGTDWHGTYYVSQATTLLEHLNLVVVTPASQTIEPQPTTEFVVSPEATYVVGAAFSGAYAGAHVTYVVTPSNDVRRWEAVSHPLGEGSATATFFDEPAEAGVWRVVTVGAGVVAYGGLFAWEVVETPVDR